MNHPNTTLDLTILISSQWTISDNLRPYLDRYYILHWSREYTMQQIHGPGQYITHQGIDYLARYHSPNPILLDTDQVQLSFRKLPQHKNGIVLIRALDRTPSWKEQFPSGRPERNGPISTQD